jgi:hypothetical protein
MSSHILPRAEVSSEAGIAGFGAGFSGLRKTTDAMRQAEPMKLTESRT